MQYYLPISYYLMGKFNGKIGLWNKSDNGLEGQWLSLLYIMYTVHTHTWNLSWVYWVI